MLLEDVNLFIMFKISLLMPRVLIVGGGPAGSACAITTARAGLETILFERGSSGRDKVCGDILLLDSLRTIESLGLIGLVRISAVEVPKMLIHLYHDKVISLEVPTLNLQRRIFDQVLRDSVVNSGGQVCYNSQINEISINEKGVSLVNY